MKRRLFLRESSSDLKKNKCRTMSKNSLQNQRAEDLRIGEKWNQELQSPASRQDSDVCARFWTETKASIVRRYGSVVEGFRQIDTSGDGFINFQEFSQMLIAINIPLDQRVTRAMFDQASRHHSELSLEDLKTLLMEKTIQKLQSTMRGFNKKQERVRKHVHRFMEHLAVASDETLARAVDRLQRKLTMPFCRELWQMLRKHLAKIHSDGDLERSVFLQVVHGAIGLRFMAYEFPFLLRIFDRIDTHRHGRIHLRDLMTALVLLSEESSQELKLHLLFEVFDTDSDGCLLYDQILGMMQCICAHRLIVEESIKAKQDKQQSGLVFQEELTAQDGLRMYECLLWHLQRTVKLESDIVTWNELWAAFVQQPDVANAVIPGLFHMHWVLEPSDAPEPEELAAQEEQTSAQDRGGSKRTPSHCRADDCSSQLRLSREARLRTCSKTTVRDETVSDATPGDSKSRHEQVTSPDAPSKCSAATRATIRATIAYDRHHPGHHPGHQCSPAAINKFKMDNGHQAVQSKPAWEKHETTAAFKKDITNRFLSSLRNFGDVRHAELTEGFKSVDDLGNVSKEPDATSQAVSGGTTLAQVAALDDSRPASASGARHFSSETTRPGSSPAVSGRPKPSPAPGASSRGSATASMSRCGSAPAGLDARAAGLSRRGSSAGSSMRIPSSAELPTIDSQRWGMESADRFRLFSTVRAGKNNARHLVGCGHAEGGLAYKCQLCQRQHMMLTSF